MVRKQSDIDWYSVFLAAFSHDGAVDADNDSRAPRLQAPTSPGGRERFEEPHNEFERRFGSDAPVDDEPHFRLTRATTKVCKPASSLLCSCNENKLWCLIICVLSVP